MNLSTKNITFLRDVPSSIIVDSKSGWRYRFFQEFSVYEISTFIKSIENDKIYMIIPQFASSKSLSQARLNLSEDFLINNNSNPMLITQFILNQWETSGFNIDKGITFCFKFKRVWLKYK
jgi:hypothetical protein